MRRLNFLEDEPWDEVLDELRTRVRWFGHPFDADMLGASLHELLPGAPGGPLHMHYGVEEMFFVLAGTPAVRTPEGEESLAPGAAPGQGRSASTMSVSSGKRGGRLVRPCNGADSSRPEREPG